MRYFLFFTLFSGFGIFVYFSVPFSAVNDKSLSNSKNIKPAAAYERQEFFLKKRLATGQEHLPMNAYASAQNILQDRISFSTNSAQLLSKNSSKQEKMATAWQWMGPGNVGGRTRSLVFNPVDDNIMYAGGVSGGVWKTTDAGASWQAIGDKMANINIGVIAIDPVQPKTLYVGTGELYRKTLRPYSNMTGAGIFKSIDGGETWIQLMASNSENFMYVSDIVISQSNHKRLYAATNTGVWRSDDGGISFSQSLFPNDGLGNSMYEGCNDLSIRTDKSDDWLLVSCASRSTDDRYYLPGLLPTACNGQPCDARIYLNKNAQSSTEWNVVLTESGMGRTQMSIHQANQDIIYASSSSTNRGPDLNGDFQGDLANGLHAIFRSDDGGQTWQATLRNTNATILNTQLFSYAEGALNIQCGGTSNWYYSAGWYNQAIAVDPINPNTVWVAGMEVYRSDDGGHNFGMASHWDALFFNDASVAGAYVHADQHSIVFHPHYDGTNNKKMFTTNDGGIAFTNDNTQRVIYGETAPCVPPTDGVKWGNLNNNYGVTQFYTGDVAADGSFFIAGAQDNGTQLGSAASGVNNWQHIFGGDGSELAINPNNSNNLYASSQYANLVKSFDKGQTWSFAANGVNGRFIFITPFLLDHNNPNRLYLGGQYLWRSNDQGENWQVISPSLGNNYNDMISAMTINPNNPQHMLYGNRTHIYKNTQVLNNNPANSQTSSSPREGWVSSLAIDPNNSQVAYATYSTFGGTHVFKSTDGGSSWLPLDGSNDGKLPDVPVHSLVIDPNNSQRLYIGTDLGVFVSLDGGEHWLVENTGFSQVITERLVVSSPQDNSTPYLFAFTYGRGVWRVPLNDLDAQVDYSINSQISGLWYNPEQSGHGLQIEIIEQNNQEKLYVSWYSYLNGEPIWLTGIGEIDKNQSTIDVLITTGTNFPGNGFDAQEVQRIPWGQLQLDFSDDDNGQLSWSSVLDDYNNGSIAIKKITTIGQNNPSNGISACESGTWYNSSQNGHGFMLEVLDNSPTQTQMIMTWFTYHQGKQYWIIAIGDVNGNTAQLDATVSSGSSFPPDFNADDIDRTNWGTLTFTKIDDENATISWNPVLAGFTSDSIDVTRITHISDHNCSNE